MTEEDLTREELIARAEAALGRLTEKEAQQVISRARAKDTANKQATAASKVQEFIRGVPLERS
jgi:hypothetical protein